MVAFVIFWSAMFAIIFFMAGTCFKALASAFNALISSLGAVLAFAGLAFLAAIALCLIYEMIEAIAGGSLGQILGTILLIGVEAAILFAIFGGIGAMILEIVVMVVTYALTAVSFVLEKAAFICEKGYAKSLTAIIRRLDRC